MVQECRAFPDTEEITGDTFNRKVADTHSHYGDVDHWQLRYDNFRTVTRAQAFAKSIA